MPAEGPIGARVRLYRRRRGITQAALAGLVGRSESWLSQVERGIRPVDRLSVLIDIAQVLKINVETLAGQPFSFESDNIPESAELEPIRTALSSYPAFDDAPAPSVTLDEAQQLITEVHRRYQAADYAHAARLLPGLISGVDALVVEGGRSVERTALTAQGSAYVAAAKLVTKVGDPQLAWLAADRAANAGQRGDNPLLSAAAAYQVVCAFLKADQLDEAERIAVTTADSLADTDDPLGLSLRGTLTLIGSIIAGRRNDRTESAERLAHAGKLAESLGRDGNYGWTGFGPTNVRIHSVSAAVELGHASEAIARAESLNTRSLPAGLLSRRAQVHIDCACAYAQRRQDAASVVNLLEAERIAPQTLRYNLVVRELVRDMLKRERRAVTPGLRALAERAEILP